MHRRTFLAAAIATLAGPTPMPVLAVRPQIVSVLDFGADPLGRFDSSAAFAAALATGKDVFVPTGAYCMYGAFAIDVRAARVLRSR